LEVLFWNELKKPFQLLAELEKEFFFCKHDLPLPIDLQQHLLVPAFARINADNLKSPHVAEFPQPAAYGVAVGMLGRRISPEHVSFQVP
jgi:hypothetical protein